MGLSVWQVILILAVVLIIFGAGKLPRVMGDLAQGIKNFKAGMAGDDKPSEAASSASLAHQAPAANGDSAPYDKVSSAGNS